MESKRCNAQPERALAWCRICTDMAWVRCRPYRIEQTGEMAALSGAAVVHADSGASMKFTSPLCKLPQSLCAAYARFSTVSTRAFPAYATGEIEMPCLLYQRVARRCAASSAAALFTVLACPAMADTTPVQDGASPAAQPDYTLVPNIGVASQYRYRGLMQSAGYPAVSGGLDFTHKSGFYLGNWDSTIRWLGNSNGQISAPVETDFYGGYKNSINSDWSYDLGVLRYQYFGNYPSGTVSPNTTELYGALTYKSLTFKYSYATSNLFGATNSQHSQYFDLSDNYDTGVWGL